MDGYIYIGRGGLPSVELALPTGVFNKGFLRRRGEDGVVTSYCTYLAIIGLVVVSFVVVE